MSGLQGRRFPELLPIATRSILCAQLKSHLPRHLKKVCCQSEPAKGQPLERPFFAGATTPFLPLGWVVVLLMLCTLLLGPAAQAGSEAAKASPAWCGEYGSDLGWLADFYTPPQVRGESNHYIDLWEGNTLRTMALSSGLTNNRTLFV